MKRRGRLQQPQKPHAGHGIGCPTRGYSEKLFSDGGGVRISSHHSPQNLPGLTSNRETTPTNLTRTHTNNCYFTGFDLPTVLSPERSLVFFLVACGCLTLPASYTLLIWVPGHLLHPQHALDLAGTVPAEGHHLIQPQLKGQPHVATFCTT
ncbi:hypothetical protein CB1_001107068 [Camelus ferus]|nr:hypothetical protein CB1_001107068 [Camelus ferus]